MLILIIFSFISGIVTIVSPCVLPILPILLSTTVGGIKSSKLHPIGVITGFILSFSIFTLFLSSIVQIIGISADTLRIFSIGIIAIFGLVLVLPNAQRVFEHLFSKVVLKQPNSSIQNGFSGGIIIGLSIGFLWTPCVGPILASVIALAVTGRVTANALLIIVSYSLGTALPMFAIMIGGRELLKKTPWLTNNTLRIQKLFGVVMIVTALAIGINLDRKFQTFVITSFPKYGSGLTSFEQNDAVTKQLKNIGNSQTTSVNTINLANGYMAPELTAGGSWINSEPLKLKDLHGKVILIDFWTYTCINCQRTLPYLRSWYDKYNTKGLVIIGVHTPEFEFEKELKNVTTAVSDFNLKYPIMQDNNFSTWNSYNNRYWPAKYLIDKDGNVRYTHFGEGNYDETEKAIQELLKEAGTVTRIESPNNQTYEIYARTPETYLGYARLQNFNSVEKVSPDVITEYTSPNIIRANNVAYQGKWLVNAESANPQSNANLLLNFNAMEVFLVMKPKVEGSQSTITVYVDDKQQYFGDDVNKGKVIVNKDRLYKLVKLTNPGQHILRIEFSTNDIQIFAFTFG